MDKNAYEEKLEREKNWYKQPVLKSGFISRLLRTPLFYSPGRQAYAYRCAKEQMSAAAARRGTGKAGKLLIAPCGSGDDYKYLKQFGETIYGIDLSPEAVKACPPEMETKTGDVLQSGYPDNMFDTIASPLFFHHLLKFGFAPFLKEFYRILKPGGSIVIIEPSVLYPINVFTRPIKRLYHNPLNEVEDEAPFYPGKLIKALKKSGYINVEMMGASFSHVVFPVAIAKAVNAVTKPLQRISPFKYFAWMVVYRAEKPGDQEVSRN
jgi:SAM-dependent methyltransferase